MNPSLSDQIQIDYQKANSDSNGHRNVTGTQETVQYPDNSSVRIWYNQETIPYDFHWHTALEIIMPVENYYDVETPQASYHIDPGEILLIPPWKCTA